MHCPSCGGEVASDSDYCRHCGEGIEESPDREEESPNSPEPETDTSDESGSGLKTVGFWVGRLGQVALVGVAVILLLGSIMGNMNVIAFASIGVFALVLLAGVGVIEFLVIRPIS